jgi:hypothetical protein
VSGCIRCATHNRPQMLTSPSTTQRLFPAARSADVTTARSEFSVGRIFFGAATPLHPPSFRIAALLLLRGGVHFHLRSDPDPSYKPQSGTARAARSRRLTTMRRVRVCSSAPPRASHLGARTSLAPTTSPAHLPPTAFAPYRPWRLVNNHNGARCSGG